MDTISILLNQFKRYTAPLQVCVLHDKNRTLRSKQTKSTYTFKFYLAHFKQTFELLIFPNEHTSLTYFAILRKFRKKGNKYTLSSSSIWLHSLKSVTTPSLTNVLH